MELQKTQVYEQIKEYFTGKPVKKVFMFGSFSRNEEKNNSDIDIIIQTSHPIGLIALGNYVADLEEITSRKIDLATHNSLTPEFLSLIQKDLREVYAA